MKDAKKVGLVTFCDVQVWGIRVVPKDEIEDLNVDPRERGEVVDCSTEPHDPRAYARGEIVACETACGTPTSRSPNM